MWTLWLRTICKTREQSFLLLSQPIRCLRCSKSSCIIYTWHRLHTTELLLITASGHRHSRHSRTSSECWPFGGENHRWDQDPTCTFCLALLCFPLCLSAMPSLFDFASLCSSLHCSSLLLNIHLFWSMYLVGQKISHYSDCISTCLLICLYHWLSSRCPNESGSHQSWWRGWSAVRG
jgi:hypothetical protein